MEHEDKVGIALGFSFMWALAASLLVWHYAAESSRFDRAYSKAEAENWRLSETLRACSTAVEHFAPDTVSVSVYGGSVRPLFTWPFGADSLFDKTDGWYDEELEETLARIWQDSVLFVQIFGQLPDSSYYALDSAVTEYLKRIPKHNDPPDSNSQCPFAYQHRNPFGVCVLFDMPPHMTGKGGSHEFDWLIDEMTYQPKPTRI